MFSVMFSDLKWRGRERVEGGSYPYEILFFFFVFSKFIWLCGKISLNAPMN